MSCGENDCSWFSTLLTDKPSHREKGSRLHQLSPETSSRLQREEPGKEDHRKRRYRRLAVRDPTLPKTMRSLRRYATLAACHASTLRLFHLLRCEAFSGGFEQLAHDSVGLAHNARTQGHRRPPQTATGSGGSGEH
ncbi:hypothetical protein MRX96_015263 [Rhipicephalus microplus]